MTQKITGYRELTPEQKQQMNQLKEKGNELGALLDELFEQDGLDKRALAIAKTEIQTGMMWAIRSIAQPTTFS